MLSAPILGAWVLGLGLVSTGKVHEPTNGDKMALTMSRLATAALTADRIDYWIRRHVIQYWHEAHPSQHKLSPVQDRRIGPSAIGLTVRTGKAKRDQMFSGLPPKADFPILELTHYPLYLG
jgi:hypothetical protein